MKIKAIQAHADKVVLPHHVSLSISNAPNDLEIPPPIGSGTFLKCSRKNGKTLYGILTAQHISEKVMPKSHKPEVKIRTCLLIYKFKGWIGLSIKKGAETLGCSVQPMMFYNKSSKIPLSDKNISTFPDISFILLGVNGYPTCECIDESSFYNWDGNPTIEVENTNIFSAFFRGAAPPKWEGSSYMNTFTAITGGEELKTDRDSMVQCWKIPCPERVPIHGASGAGFWRMDCSKRPYRKSLCGVIVAQSEDCICIDAMGEESIHAMFNEMLETIPEKLLKDYETIHAKQ